MKKVGYVTVALMPIWLATNDVTNVGMRKIAECPSTVETVHIFQEFKGCKGCQLNKVFNIFQGTRDSIFRANFMLKIQ